MIIISGTKGNRRTIYTKNSIKDSLIKLLQDKEIHQVTVTDICKKADVNRGTFYKYYTDSYDLLYKMEDEFFEKFYTYLKDYNDTSLLHMLKIIEDNKELSKIIFCQQKDNKILERVLAIAKTVDIEGLVKETSAFNNVYKDYFLKYSVGGVLSIVQSWLENDMKESSEEMFRIINAINEI